MSLAGGGDKAQDKDKDKENQNQKGNERRKHRITTEEECESEPSSEPRVRSRKLSSSRPKSKKVNRSPTKKLRPLMTQGPGSDADISESATSDPESINFVDVLNDLGTRRHKDPDLTPTEDNPPAIDNEPSGSNVDQNANPDELNPSMSQAPELASFMVPDLNKPINCDDYESSTTPEPVSGHSTSPDRSGGSTPDSDNSAAILETDPEPKKSDN